MINLSMPNWTQNQKLVAAALLSILVSAVSTTATAVVQSYTNSGLDIPVLVNVAIVSFFPLLGAALLNYIPAHALQIMQTLQDSTQQAQQSLQGLQQQHNALIAATVQAKSQPAPQPAQIAPTPPTLVAVPTQANSGYVDPLATPITEQMPVPQLPFPVQS